MFFFSLFRKCYVGSWWIWCRLFTVSSEYIMFCSLILQRTVLSRNNLILRLRFGRGSIWSSVVRLRFGSGTGSIAVPVRLRCVCGSISVRLKFVCGSVAVLLRSTDKNRKWPQEKITQLVYDGYRSFPIGNALVMESYYRVRTAIYRKSEMNVWLITHRLIEWSLYYRLWVNICQNVVKCNANKQQTRWLTGKLFKSLWPHQINNISYFSYYIEMTTQLGSFHGQEWKYSSLLISIILIL